MTGSPLDGIAKTLAGIKTGLTISDQIVSITRHFKPYKPEVKSFRIDYLNRSSEIKYLLEIPSGISRRTRRRVELPATYGFKIYDVVDLDTGGLVRVTFDEKDRKWMCNLGDFPNSERFLVTVQGVVGKDFLDRLVDVKAATNPQRKNGIDRYWVHAALRDVSILEKVWSELNIDRVDADVRIGVERFFTSAIPMEVPKGLAVQQKLLDAIRRGDRNIDGLKLKYRRTELASGISPAELHELIRRLVSGEFFIDFISAERPFILGGIEPEHEFTSLVPERVKVGVLSDLNLQRPAAKGSLQFDRRQYVDSISREIGQITRKKTKRKKKAKKRK